MRRTRLKVGLCVMAMVFAGMFLFLGAAESDMGGMAFSGVLGTVTVDGKQWQRISLRPDVPIGPFGVALDIELFINSEGEFSKKGWEFDTAQKAWDSVLRKIYYVRYGRPGRNAFIKVGALDEVTLGYGLIVDGYRNTLQYPGVKKTGLQFDLRGMSSFGLEVEGLINDFGDFGEGGALIGVRVSAQPLGMTTIPILGGLRVGGTYAVDLNQYAGLRDSDGDEVPDGLDPFPNDKTAWMNTDADSLYGDTIPDYRIKKGHTDTTWVDILDMNGNNIYDRDEAGYDGPWSFMGPEPFKKSDSRDRTSVWGVDVGMPLLRAPVDLDLYAQFAKLDTRGDFEGGRALSGPGLRLRAGPLTARLEYRNVEGRFQPEYFNDQYELERARIKSKEIETKESLLDSLSVSGVFGQAALPLGNYIQLGATYQYLTGEDQKDQRFYADAMALPLILHQVPKLNHLSGYYHKNNIDTEEASFFEPTVGTIYGYKVGFGIGAGVTLMWTMEYQYKFKGGTKDVKRQKFMTVETVITMR